MEQNELIDLIAQLISKHYATYEHIRRFHAKDIPNANLTIARGYASILRHHVLNAHTYITMGKPEQCLTEIKSAYAILVAHNVPSRNEYSDELNVLFKRIIGILEPDENN